MTEKRQDDKGIDKIFAAKTTEEIIEVMREEDEEAARARIIEKMTPACLEKLKQIETLLHKAVHDILRARYELGTVALELLEDQKKNGGKLYGKNAIGRIGKVLHWDEGLIRMCLHFAQAYSREDLERFCSMKLPSGSPLTWSHLRSLIPLKAQERETLLDRTVSEGWTCTELVHQIKHLDEDKTPDGRGRPLKAPPDFDSAVAQQLEHAEQWDRRYGKVWSQSSTSLPTQAAKLKAEEVTKERVQKLKELAHQLRVVEAQVGKQAEAAEQAAGELEQLLQDREKATLGVKLFEGKAKILEVQNDERSTVVPPARTSRKERQKARS